MFFVVNLKGEDHLEDLHVYERIILELMSDKYVFKEWTVFNWYRTESNDGSCRQGNERFNPLKPSGYYMCHLL
jgi:hypothetical protein